MNYINFSKSYHVRTLTKRDIPLILALCEKNTVMDFIDHYPTEQSCFIGFFMMERSVQGHGIGSRIITELCVYLHSLGYEYIRLGYVDGNKQSELFWKKNQFTDTGLRDHTQDYTVVVMNRML